MGRKKKKRLRLPNGWGSIKYLGKNRRNPYAVHPPATQCRENGSYIQPRPLCYVSDWNVGFAVLAAYRAGNYHKGDELKFETEMNEDMPVDKLIARFIARESQAQGEGPKKHTFREVYEMFAEWKWGPNRERDITEGTIANLKLCYKRCAKFHGRIFEDLRLVDLQGLINELDYSKATLKVTLSFLHQLYSFACMREIVDKDYSEHVIVPSKAADQVDRIPFSDDEILQLWQAYRAGDEDLDLVLILIYTGFRREELLKASLNLEEWYFQGGVKTKAGKDRIVPIIPCIQPLVSSRVERFGEVCPWSDVKSVNHNFNLCMKRVGMKHTPHDCRHTFSYLCEKFGVREADQKRLMGHSFGNDVTKSVYGHRSIDDLRKEIEKIQPPEGF